MPPPLPRPPMRTWSASIPSRSRLSSSSFWGTRAGAYRLSSTTSSSSSSSGGPTVPPESPRFIKIPEPPQAHPIKHPNIKGHLPVPREIFNRRGLDGDHKTSAAYLKATARRSAGELAGEAPISDKAAWRRQNAEARRRSLSAGLRGLWARKQRREARDATRQSDAMARNRLLALAPEAVDDVLTRPTVRLATAGPTATAVPADPGRFTAAEASAEETARRQALAAEARRDALQELYVAARDFIVTEAQLEAKVEEIFAEDYWRRRSGGLSVEGENIWTAEGAPLTVSQMVTEMTRTQARAMDYNTSEKQRTVLRQKTVAEELTGGKME